MPGTAFVHNRLTHSLEVASVGRSLGRLVGEAIAKPFQHIHEPAWEFYKYELPNVVAAACLAHDIGNPAFGHSGEKAISAYFIDNAGLQVDGRSLRSYYNDAQWADLTAFEGNANAIRMLTHQFKGKFRGGYGLTYTTIAALLKYPCESVAVDKNWRHRKKYGFFQSEKDTVLQIMQELGMMEESANPLVYKRHPFVYLVEAADDICYNIVDMEDAQRLGILSKHEVESIFFDVLKKINRPGEDVSKTSRYYSELQDINEAIAFLRAKVINALTELAAEIFISNQESILEGTYNQTLIGAIEDHTQALADVVDISVKRIYNHHTVVQVEIAGYNVMSELLDLFIPAMLRDAPTMKQQKVLQLVPFQFTDFRNAKTGYDKTMNALDLISGMTDEYATELYRRVKGIDIPKHG